MKHIIKEVRLMPENFTIAECIIYVDFMGIPPTLICESLIRFLETCFGRVVSVDFNFERPDCLDVVSCLVSVPIGTSTRTFKLIMGNREVIVHTNLRQGIGCDRCQQTEGDVSSVSTDSDGYSVDENSHGQSHSSQEESSTRVKHEVLIIDLSNPSSNSISVIPEMNSVQRAMTDPVRGNSREG